MMIFDVLPFSRKPAFKLIFICLSILFCIFPNFFYEIYVTGVNAVSPLELAQEAVNSAYKEIHEAELVGGEVAELITNLNLATIFLNQAYTKFYQGNLSGSDYFANLCYQDASEIAVEASELRYATIATNSQRVWFIILKSVIASGILVGASFFVWRTFLRHYYRKILKMHPEVDRSES